MLLNMNMKFLDKFDLKSLKISIGLILNVFSTIWLNELNKILSDLFEFPKLTLTCYHFIITFLGLIVLSRCCCSFKLAILPLDQMLPMSLSFCGFVVLSHYSMENNSIGFFQCLKVLTIPGVMYISSKYYNISYSKNIRLSIVSF